jgi:predicted RNase H-like nuclease (RuvC/YqgF family)
MSNPRTSRTARLPAILQRVGRLQRKQRPPGDDVDDQAASGLEQRVQAMERRLTHLEAMTEGLQDSVHRESVRRGRQIDELQESIEPGALRRALSEDAREHGL